MEVIMTLRDRLDNFIEDAIAESYPPAVAATVLCCEDCTLNDELLLDMIKQELLETKRTFRKLPGGGKMLIRRTGPVSIKRRMAAKKAARKGRAARLRASRNPRSKMKRKRTMAARKRLLGNRRKSSRRPRIRFSPRRRRR